MSSSAAHKVANRLVTSTSPYLLQHAYNPVNWFEWGSEALDTAVREKKPILVSIGYSSCHWCHVMERESFENEDIAAVMNEHLVCIKVDREERPDIDQLYMDAVQVMGLQGGWPLNVFLTPDQKPFYGGTYFPPKNWAQLIVQLSRTFKDRRSQIEQSADEIAEHLKTTDLSRFTTDAGPFDPDDFHQTFGLLEARFDKVYGGMEKAPKFVMPAIWMWLLRYHHHTKNQQALDMVQLTLRQLAAGGIYDQVGGGFSRYSVDAKWFAPHFEKMLYDNAQLISLYSEAYRVSPEPLFRTVVYETIGWLHREMKHPDGGYYSALDADSEGVEGKYYTWTNKELHDALGDQAHLIRQHYQLTDEGNWEHNRNILYRTHGPEGFSDDEGLQNARRELLRRREKRVHPGLDDKIVTSWNAMLVQGLADAYKSFNDPTLLKDAVQILQFVECNLAEEPRIYRTYRTRRNNSEGFLEDYALLIAAYLAVYECTWDESWLFKAERKCLYVIEKFRDDSDGFFYFSGSSAEKLLARKKEVFDNVMPSSNSVMARNLFRLGVMLDREEWKQDAMEMASSLRKMILHEPAYMSNWGMLSMEMTYPFHEIIITGREAEAMRKDLAHVYLPFSVVMGTKTTSELPLLRGKGESDKAQIHVCVNKTCSLPVGSVREALQIIYN